MSEENNTPTGTLEKGKLVTIVGLQSDAGKKLKNGGKGILLAGPSVVNGATRFPVRFYATLDEEGNLKLLDEPMDKKLKEENIELAEYNKLFFDAVVKLGVQQDPYEVVDLKTVDNQDKYWIEQDKLTGESAKRMLFWLESHYNLKPTHVRVTIVYANILRFTGQTKKAAEVLEPYIPLIDKEDPLYHTNCYDACAILAGADRHMDTALDLALEMPKNDPKRRQIIRHFIKRCTELKNQDPRGDRKDLSELHIKAVKKAIEAEPDDALLHMELGVAYCLADKHVEGARWYRKAWSSGRLDAENHEAAGINLARAQMQCPGMPLADYHIISVVPPSYICLENEFRQFLFDAGGGQIGLQGADGVEVSVIHHEIPNGPEDPEFFSQSFLETVHPDRIEEENIQVDN